MDDHKDRLPFTPGSFISYMLSLAQVKEAWQKHTQHPFVLDLGRGVLPESAFKRYLIQDYHFLLHYAKFGCILASRAPNTEGIFTQARQALEVENELKIHVEYCKSFELSINDILETPEHPACLAYTKFLNKIASLGDWISLQVALCPCGLGYQIVGQSLNEWDQAKKESNPYWKWMSYYAGEEYAATVKESLTMLEMYAAQENPARIEELVQIFTQAIELEVGFWDIGFSDGKQNMSTTQLKLHDS